jgi:hypothetical protein
VLEAVAKSAEVEVPDVMVDDKADEMVESFERSIRAQGIEPEQYYQLAGASQAEIRDRVRDDAADTVKKELVLDAVARAEGIGPDEHEVEHQISHLAEDTGRKPEEVARTMRQNGTYRLLEEEISRSRALDFLVENAVPVPMSPEEEGADDGGGRGSRQRGDRAGGRRGQGRGDGRGRRGAGEKGTRRGIANGLRHQQRDSLRHRAEPARRARHGHLLAASEG